MKRVARFEIGRVLTCQVPVQIEHSAINLGGNSIAHSQVSTPTNLVSNLSADCGSDVSALTKLARDVGHAYARRDLPVLEQLTADDSVQTDVRQSMAWELLTTYSRWLPLRGRTSRLRGVMDHQDQ